MHRELPVAKLAAYLREKRRMQESFAMMKHFLLLVIGVLDPPKQVRRGKQFPLAGQQAKLNRRTQNGFERAAYFPIQLPGTGFQRTLAARVINYFRYFPSTLVSSSGIVYGLRHKTRKEDEQMKGQV